MNTKKIRENNDNKFIVDLKRVSNVLVYASNSNVFLKTTKKEILREAEDRKIDYKITDKIFVRKRDVMVIL